VASGVNNTVSLSGAFVLFTPTNPNDSPLTFTYTLHDAVTNTDDTGTVTVTTATATPFTLQIVDKDGPTFAGGNTTLTVDFVGVPNQDYVIEYSIDGMATWTPYPSNPVNTGASGSFFITLTAVGQDKTTGPGNWNSMVFRARK